jgi:uncharacterized protein (TIGR02145 family)
LWYSPNADATNSSGFSGAPGGYRDVNGEYVYVGNGVYWWSSSEIDASGAWFHVLYYFFGNAYSYDDDKRNGISVRCLRD